MAEKIVIDCVEMKNRIQAELRQEYAGLSMEEERLARRRKLMTSDSLAAQMWRNAHEQRSAMVVIREDTGAYPSGEDQH